MADWVVVTGATSGIGRSVAQKFIDKGFSVLCIGRNNDQLFELVMRSVDSDKIHILRIDLSVPNAITQLEKVIKVSENVRYVVHCAVTADPMGPLSKISPEDILKCIGVNAIIPFTIMRYLMPRLSENFRALFFESDFSHDKKIIPGVTAAYAASKAVLRSNLAYWKREHPNVATGIVNPGRTDTHLFQSINNAPKFFNVKAQDKAPATVFDVSEFIVNILLNTNLNHFCNTSWDFRDANHQEIVKNTMTRMAKL